MTSLDFQYQFDCSTCEWCDSFDLAVHMYGYQILQSRNCIIYSKCKYKRVSSYIAASEASHGCLSYLGEDKNWVNQTARFALLGTIYYETLFFWLDSTVCTEFFCVTHRKSSSMSRTFASKLLELFSFNSNSRMRFVIIMVLRVIGLPGRCMRNIQGSH